MNRLRASDRSSPKRLTVAFLAVAMAATAAAAVAVPVAARIAPPPSPATVATPHLAAGPTPCADGRPWASSLGAAACARQLLVREIVVDDRAGAPTVLIRAQWQRARSPELMRLAGPLHPGCSDSPQRPCGRNDGAPRDPGPAWVLALANTGGLAVDTDGMPDPDERAEPLDLLLGGPWAPACEIDARGSSCPQLEPAQARHATQTAQRQASYAVAADIQRRPGWGEALLVRLTRQLE